jgi:RNA polymerase sigma factor (sigma-70 family)
MQSDSPAQTRFSEGQIFPQTPWSLIRRSQDAADPMAMASLDRLARAYWRPLYACVRAMGYDHAAAEDEVQRLFEVIASRDSLREVMPGESRFRSFMVTCLKNSMASQHRWKTRVKRGEGVELEVLEEGLQVLADDDPEMAMDRAWAREVFERAFTLLKEDAAKRDRAEAFVVLMPVLRGEAPAGGYAALGVQLAVTEGTVRKMVFDLRARLGLLIRNEVAATVVNPAEVEGEVRYLVSLI